jgi:3-oxoacyl-[acyl-carrier protein] reductase
MSNQETTQKVAAITGSAQGIGKAIAEHLGADGYKVVIADIRPDAAQATADELAMKGLTTLAVKCDVTAPESCDAMVASAVERFGRLDVMVNCAGISKPGPSLDVKPEDWRLMIDIQLSGTFYGCQAAGRQMVKQGWGGTIVNISSILAQAAFPQRASYCAAKAGVDMVTKVLAIEWAQYKIRVNAVGPSHTMTDMTRGLVKQGLYNLETVAKRIPMGRLAEVDDIANGVSFLCSEKASFITGQTLFVDGGYLAYGYF